MEGGCLSGNFCTIFAVQRARENESRLAPTTFHLNCKKKRKIEVGRLRWRPLASLEVGRLDPRGLTCASMLWTSARVALCVYPNNHDP